MLFRGHEFVLRQSTDYGPEDNPHLEMVAPTTISNKRAKALITEYASEQGLVVDCLKRTTDNIVYGVLRPIS